MAAALVTATRRLPLLISQVDKTALPGAAMAGLAGIIAFHTDDASVGFTFVVRSAV